MQPQQDKDGWQQPAPQSSGAPYAPPQENSVTEPALTPQAESPLSPDTQALPPDDGLAETTGDPHGVEEFDDAGSTPTGDDEPVHWQAQEYIHHEKTMLWFIIFGVVVVGLIAVAIWVMQSITFAILVPVMAVALVVYSRRPPRVLNYTLSRQGLHINDRLYPFSQFKGFGVIHDGKEYSVMLLPVKRFMPGVSVYFPEEAGEAIVDMLGVRLPMQQLRLDPIDILIHKLRI